MTEPRETTINRMWREYVAEETLPSSLSRLTAQFSEVIGKAGRLEALVRCVESAIPRLESGTESDTRVAINALKSALQTARN